MTLGESMSGRERLVAVINEHLGECSRDELRVVCAVLARLEIGRARYGLLDLEADPRDWQRELGEELLDALIYAACIRVTGAIRTAPGHRIARAARAARGSRRRVKGRA